MRIQLTSAILVKIESSLVLHIIRIFPQRFERLNMREYAQLSWRRTIHQICAKSTRARLMLKLPKYWTGTLELLVENSKETKAWWVSLNQANKKSQERRYRKSPEITEFGKAFVVYLIEQDWSPEQVSERLRAMGWEDVPSHEWIYLYIYSQTARHWFNDTFTATEKTAEMLH